MQRPSCAFLFLLLCLLAAPGCREDRPVLPDLSVPGLLKKKVLLAREDPARVLGETEYQYGPDRRLLKEESYYFRDNQRVLGEYTGYRYDNEGRQVGSTRHIQHASGNFMVYAETVFAYAGGLLVRETVSYPALVAVTTYEYAADRLVKKSFLDGSNELLHYTVYAYDGAGNLAGETNFAAPGTPTYFVQYTYQNGLRQVRQMFRGDPGGSAAPELWSTIRYGYDAQKRLVTEKTEYINLLSSAVFPTIRYEYY